MFESEYLILCSGKSSDANGNITLSGIFDTITAQGFPVIRQEMLVTAKLRAIKAINEELEVKLVIEIEDKTHLEAIMKQKVIVEKDHSWNCDFNLQGIAFPKAGKYYFKVYIEGKLYLTNFITVKPLSDYFEP